MLDFFEEKKEEISFLSKSEKYKFELAIALSLYGLIFVLWYFTSWRVEWTWRAVQLAVPILLTLGLGRPLESMGLRSQRLGKEIKLGIIGGISLSVILGPLLLGWIPPEMPTTISSKAELGYTFLLVLVNVSAIEVFYRGYIQPRLEALTKSLPGLIITSILAGFDFWEIFVFHHLFIVAGIGLTFGVLYMETRSLISPLIAHISFIMLIMLGGMV